MDHSSMESQENFVLDLQRPLGGLCLDKNLDYLVGEKNGLIRLLLTFLALAKQKWQFILWGKKSKLKELTYRATK